MHNVGVDILDALNITIWTFIMATYLDINIAVLATHARYVVLNGTSIAKNAQINSVIDRRIVAWRNVQHRSCSSNLESALCRLLVLPNPPHSVDVAVVEPEERLIRAVVELKVYCQQGLTER